MKAGTPFYTHPAYVKFLYWGRLISITGGAQVIVQGTGLLTGIIIIRLLPTTEYAYYTLANTMLGVMTMLSDGGISNGVMAQGGKVWQNKKELGTVLATGLQLRRKFAVVSLSVGIPVLSFLLLRNGTSWLATLCIVLALIPSFLAALSDSLLEIVPKLHQEIKPLQKNQVVVSIGRLGLSSIALLLFPFTAIALVVNGLVRIWGNIKLARIAYLFADKESNSDLEVRKNILNAVKRILPITLYYCLSGQIIIWIPSLLGNTMGVAEVGALSRLSMILNLVSVLGSTLVLPRFARVSADNRDVIFKSFVFIQLTLILMCLCILALFFLFPSQFLWILGKPYSNLSRELLLMILSSCIGTVSSMTGNIIGGRGWFMNPYIIITINVLSLVTSLYLFNLTQTIGVLYYSILLGTITYLFTIIYSISRILKLK